MYNIKTYKIMKKIYQKPAMEVYEIKNSSPLLSGSSVGINKTGSAVSAGHACSRGYYGDDDFDED